LSLRHGRGCALLLLALLLAAPGLARTALAEEQAKEPATEEQAQEQETVDFEALNADRAYKQKEYELGRRISRYLAAAGKKLDEKQPEEAERLLLRLDAKRLNPLQRAYVYRLLGAISYGNEEPKKAIGYFEEALKQEALPVRDENKIRFTIAQLHAQLEEWRDAVSWLNEWRRYEPNPDPLGFYLMGLAYYQMKDYDKAVEKVKEALARSTEPRESWMRMLYGIYTQEEDYTKATTVLEELLLRFPKKEYWVQLSLLYGARDDYKRSLAVQQVAYAQGFLTEDKELRRLARTYLYNDLPYPAAKVLETGLASGQIEPDAGAYELLANSWIAAREFDRALSPLQKAAELSKGGDLYVRLGQVHLQREEWEQAADSLEKGLEKGDLQKPGNAVLLLGIAYYNSDHRDRARQYFVRARGYDTTRKQADEWLAHLDKDSKPQAG
jgi:tetratricopeptide (TPR) repeat protein